MKTRKNKTKPNTSSTNQCSSVPSLPKRTIFKKPFVSSCSSRSELPWRRFVVKNPPSAVGAGCEARHQAVDLPGWVLTWWLTKPFFHLQVHGFDLPGLTAASSWRSSGQPQLQRPRTPRLSHRMGERRRRATGTTFSVQCFFASPRPAPRRGDRDGHERQGGGVWSVVSGGQWLNLKASLLQSYLTLVSFCDSQAQTTTMA